LTLIRDLNRTVVACALLSSLTLIQLSTWTSSASATAPARCQETQLDVRWTSGGAGLGHVADLLVLTNISSSTCTLKGYPTVRMTGGPSVLATIAKRTRNGYLGGLGGTSASVPIPNVTLKSHGGAASSMVEGGDVPVGSAVACVYYSKVSVTLPGLSPPYRFTSKFPGCVRPQVHPLVKGSRGTQEK
jgi:Protein of unknown function (DUF4232)